MGKIRDFGSIIDDTEAPGKMPGIMTTSGDYSSLELPVGTKYQVPEGCRFEIGKVMHFGSTVNAKISFGYGDDTVTDSATPPTNFVRLVESFPVDNAGIIYVNDIFMYVPELKYPAIQCVGGA
ncbi:MAG: hypothetical protein V3W20_05635, partial [Candidatus Neomarinimicrobiota bacterium]